MVAQSVVCSNEVYTRNINIHIDIEFFTSTILRVDTFIGVQGTPIKIPLFRSIIGAGDG